MYPNPMERSEIRAFADKFLITGRFKVEEDRGDLSYGTFTLYRHPEGGKVRRLSIPGWAVVKDDRDSQVYQALEYVLDMAAAGRKDFATYWSEMAEGVSREVAQKQYRHDHAFTRKLDRWMQDEIIPIQNAVA